MVYLNARATHGDMRIPSQWFRCARMGPLLPLLLMLIGLHTGQVHAESSALRSSRRMQERMGDAADDDTARNNVTMFPNARPTDDDVTPPRVILEPFFLTLGPTESALVDSELRFVLDTMETVVTDYVWNQTESRRHLQTQSTLEYVKFGTTAQQDYNAETERVALLFDTGVASFTAQPTPDASLVNDWVQTSLQLALVDELQSVLTFRSIDTLEFQWKNPVPVAAPTAVVPVPTAPTVVVAVPTATVPTVPEDPVPTAPVPAPVPTTPETDTSRSAEGNGVNVPLIAGTTIAAAACLMLVLVAAATRRTPKATRAVEEKSATHDLKAHTDGTPNIPKSLPVGMVPGGANSNDERSVADSESEWTVATEAGDTTALKSIYPNSLSNGAATTLLPPPDPIGLTLSESFERDRQVAITKDMLTGQWSGRIHHRGGTSGPQSESVLQPSHFSASQERRVRKAAKAAAAVKSSVPDRETSSISSREETSSNDGSLGVEPTSGTSFWKSQGVQVSPSQASKRRTMARSSPPLGGKAEL